MKTSHRSSIGLVLLLLLTIGCSRAPQTTERKVAPEKDAVSDPSGTEEQPSEVADLQSPEQCYAAYLQALQAKDQAAMIACFTEQDRNRWIGWYAYYLDREIFFERKNAQAAKEILAKHGVDVGRVMGYVNRSSHLNIQPLESVLARIGAKVVDGEEFLRKASKLVNVKSESTVVATPTTKLSNVSKDGDSATGRLTEAKTGATARMLFQRESGHWLIRLDNVQAKRNVLSESEAPDADAL